MIGGGRRALGIACVVSGAALLAYAASVTIAAAAWQHRARQLATGASSLPSAKPVARGRLRIARLGIDVMVAEGTDRLTLSLGPGHLAGSALPGEADNCVIAGHRDGVFGRLRGVRAGDMVEIATGGAAAFYRVDTVAIVDREDTSPLAPAREPVLTLVTCHPFNHVGPAPRRFVVRATAHPRSPPDEPEP